MARTLSLAAIAHKVSALPPLTDPALDAAYALLEELSNAEGLKPEHIAATGTQTERSDMDSPLATAIAILTRRTCENWEWRYRLDELKETRSRKTSVEFGL